MSGDDVILVPPHYVDAVMFRNKFHELFPDVAARALKSKMKPPFQISVLDNAGFCHLVVEAKPEGEEWSLNVLEADVTYTVEDKLQLPGSLSVRDVEGHVLTLRLEIDLGFVN